MGVMRLWQWILWIGVGLFVLSRVFLLLSFPVFNDEAIYLQYSQLVHQDFDKYKFVSEGGMYADWKPPLQYWVGSAFMELASDPLAAGRLASLFISLLGLWGVYLFVRQLFGKKEAAVAVLLYALCPPALFYNNQFVAETFVFSLAPFMYWAFLKATGGEKIRPLYAVIAAVFGALVILSKQSGMVYVLLAVLLPLAAFGRREETQRRRGEDHRREKVAVTRWDWGGLLARFGTVAGGLLLAYILSRLGISSASAQVQGRFDSNWLMSIGDLLKLPTAIWHTNWTFIRDYYYHYYSVFILLPLAYFFYLAVRNAWKRSFKDGLLALGFLAGSFAVLVLLKGFNEYIYNTAVIVFLIPMLARAFLAALDAAKLKRERALGAAVLLSFVLLAGHWAYQDGLMKASAAGYIRRSSPWAVANYLNNWSGGFGVAEAISFLKEQPGPGLVLADPQWGNPRTAMEVWNKDYPDLRVIGMTSDFQSEDGTQAAKAHIDTQPFKSRLAVFSAATNQGRILWQENVEKYLCATRKEIQVEPQQPPIVVCTF